MRAIRAAVGIQPVVGKRIVYYLQVIGRYQAVRIKYDKVIAFGAFKTKVAGKALAFVGFLKITYIQYACIALNNIFGPVYRTILYHQNLKVFISLLYKGA